MKVKITGDGSSLWGKSDEAYDITKVEVSSVSPDDGKSYGIVELFGKTTVWEHYTDDRIEHEVNANEEIRTEIKRQLKEQYPDLKYTEMKISWSEQGMQPDKGWNFDLILS